MPRSRGAQQVPAAQDLLEEAEEDLDRPAVLVQERDDLRRHVQQVGHDAQHAVADAGPVCPPPFLSLPRLPWGVHLHAHQPRRVVAPARAAASCDSPISTTWSLITPASRPPASAAARRARRRRCCRARGRRSCCPAALMSFHSGELGVPPVHHVGVAGGEVAAQDALLVAVAGVARASVTSQLRRHVVVHVEVQVQPPGVAVAAGAVDAAAGTSPRPPCTACR